MKTCIVHTSNFSTLKIHKNLLCISDRHETCKDCSATILPCVMQISDLYAFPVLFYEPVNVQNLMCELCTFSQIRSQMCPVAGADLEGPLES